jgi:hypothetical protein
MTSEEHLGMLITRAYLDSLHADNDAPSHATYRTLMAHRDVVVAEREQLVERQRRIEMNNHNSGVSL